MALRPGERVKHWRELRNLTQLELARRVKMRPSKLCRIETGKQEPRTSEIEALISAMDLSITEFYGEAAAS